MGYGMGFGFGWIWPILLVIGLGVLVWGLTRARRGAPSDAPPSAPPGAPSDPGPHQQAGDSARAILRQRFARGEIDEAEFRERMRLLDER